MGAPTSHPQIFGKKLDLIGRILSRIEYRHINLSNFNVWSDNRSVGYYPQIPYSKSNDVTMWSINPTCNVMWDRWRNPVCIEYWTDPQTISRHKCEGTECWRGFLTFPMYKSSWCKQSRTLIVRYRWDLWAFGSHSEWKRRRVVGKGSRWGLWRLTLSGTTASPDLKPFNRRGIFWVMAWSLIILE